MSSFVGHTIAGLTVSRFTKSKKISWQWTIWLIFLATAPDLIYIELWTIGTTSIFKYSHSIGFISALIIFTTVFFWIRKDPNLKNKTLLAICATSSHLVLDLLVGVFPKPFLWPFSSETIRLPFGILPSAGKLDLFNYYLYRNLFIELGIILPSVILTFLYTHHKQVAYLKTKLLALTSTWFFFIYWGTSLSRG